MPWIGRDLDLAEGDVADDLLVVARNQGNGKLAGVAKCVDELGFVLVAKSRSDDCVDRCDVVGALWSIADFGHWL